jgi:hypothetical protein
MVRHSAYLFAATLFLAPMPAIACAPPSVHFAPGSVRLNAEGRREIAYALEGYRTGSGRRFMLRASSRVNASAAAAVRLARRRAEAVKAALIRRGVPANHVAIDSRSIANVGSGSTPMIWIETIVARSGCGG